MKTRSLLLFTTLLSSAALLTVPSFAKGKEESEATRIVKQFDKNGNHRIDSTEVAAVQAAYAKDPKGPLRQFDKNGDGILQESEIFAIKEPAPKMKMRRHR